MALTRRTLLAALLALPLVPLSPSLATRWTDADGIHWTRAGGTVTAMHSGQVLAIR